MTIIFSAGFTLWLLTVTMLVVWYGLLVGVAAVAITLALILYGIASPSPFPNELQKRRG